MGGVVHDNFTHCTAGSMLALKYTTMKHSTLDFGSVDGCQTKPSSCTDANDLVCCRAALTLEYEFATTLDFGGITTTEAEGAIMRANKGGSCTASQLRSIVALAAGAERLRRQVREIGRYWV